MKMKNEQNLINKLKEEFKYRDEKDMKKLTPITDILIPQEIKKEQMIQFFSKIDLAEQYIKRFPLYYDESGIWWRWFSDKWEITDEINFLNAINNLATINIIRPGERAEIINALKQVARLKKPQNVKKTWIQFNNEIVDIETGHRFKSSPEYFVTNPIPYDIGSKEDTPTIDKIFKEWVGEKHVQTLYEIIAYCLLPDYPINRLFCLIGSGMNGKSCFLNLIRKFIGENNVCSTELDMLLNSRFEITRLHKKLVCMMGETNFNEMNKTSIIKKLTGGDLIGFEYKNKTPFEEVNYSKIILATNNLPTTTDKTIGFYRRWLIIDFPNQFSEKKDIISEIPEEEFENLANKSIGILIELLKNREFTNEGDIDERMKRYEEKSNPLEKFWKDNIEEDLDAYIFKYDLRKKLTEWLKEKGFRDVSDRGIAQFMKDKNIDTQQKQAGWHTNEGKKPVLRAWIGIKWR